ncbi:MAG TPA: SRPBCC domain-containing protein [Chloroflexi bacterium]|nr:SRPBCC domain-containing protein [Chloroflexota bacterium]
MAEQKRSEERQQTEDSLVITRTFDAPREHVWKAWTDPERYMCWFGPKGFTAPIVKIDLRVGGKFLGAMRSPEGQDFWSTGTYREIVEPERLVVTDSFADEKGNVVSASHYGMTADWPEELLVTVTFEGIDGRTRMTLKHSGLLGAPAAEVENMRQGWNESFDKLADCLAEA